MTPAHRHLLSRVGMLVLATVALDLAGSAAIYLFERGARGTGIHSLGDALFWTSTQLTTVSSQLPNPASTPARILDVALQAYAVGVVAILAGSFGAFFHGRSMERAEDAAWHGADRSGARAPRESHDSV
jgi:hypothetical protein